VANGPNIFQMLLVSTKQVLHEFCSIIMVLLQYRRGVFSICHSVSYRQAV